MNRRMMIMVTGALALVVAVVSLAIPKTLTAQSPASAQQLKNLLKRFPDADANRDGKLTLEEANQYRKKMQPRATDSAGRRQGAPREFRVDPGWQSEGFPDSAVCYRSPDEIKSIYERSVGNKQPAVVSYKEPTDGAMRIVGTGHSFMAPGYRTFPVICKAAGMTQPLYTHTGGGITGSTRYKWEQENGIFDFAGRPQPKLLASIANAKWDAMMWGPYFNDRAEYYSCWVDFCLKYNPDMKFYLSDAWPQLYQLGENPTSESFFTPEVFDRIGGERRQEYAERVEVLRKSYPGKIFVMPTSDAMVLAAKSFLKGELPGVDGIHQVIGKKERSLWRDQLGHLGPGFDRLEGYVFYATLYGKSPELISTEIPFGGQADFPGPKLDRVFREIAWKAVTEHPLSGVVDQDGDGLNDDL